MCTLSLTSKGEEDPLNHDSISKWTNPAVEKVSRNPAAISQFEALVTPLANTEPCPLVWWRLAETSALTLKKTRRGGVTRALNASKMGDGGTLAVS